MGRWSRPLAETFVRWMDAPPAGDWLDVGAGTGALAAAICEIAQPTSVVGCDPSEAFVDIARSRTADPRVTWQVAGTGELPRHGGGYDAVVSGLALNFFPNPRGAVQEQLGLARPDGLVGAFVWDYAEGMEFLRLFWDAAIKVEARAAELDEGRRFPICHPKALKALFSSSGARHVRVAPISVATVFSDFDDYWRPFLGGTGPAPSFVATLSGEQRMALETELRKGLPFMNGGSIHLSARAWAVLGRAGRRPSSRSLA